MVRREIKRQLQRYGKYLEPFEILVLLGIFIIPILALINLAPQYGLPDTTPDNVLGVTSGQSSRLQDVGGSHNYIINERLLTLDPTTYHYYTTITERAAGTYGKPILQIKNPTQYETEVSFSVKNTIEQSSQVGIMDGSTNYVIKDSDGYIYPRTFKIPSGTTMTFYLDIRSEIDINYSEEIGLLIQVNDPTIELTGDEIPTETIDSSNDGSVNVTTDEQVELDSSEPTTTPDREEPEVSEFLDDPQDRSDN